VLRRNRWESRFGKETTADLAYVDRTEDDATRSAPERKPPQVELDASIASRPQWQAWFSAFPLSSFIPT
jgi:hypothetical protein